jgi:aspartyl-tRNA synthetase
MERIMIKDLTKHIGEEVLIKGWVDVRRDQGKIIFIDFRDVSGKVQCVAGPWNKEAHAQSEIVRPEWVLSIKGKVNARPEKNINADEANGTVEIELLGVEVLNQSVTPPFDIRGDARDINEDIRMKYRYLDLRRERLQKNIEMRHKASLLIRNQLDKELFKEIETPILTIATAEGARDYIVPSRVENGKCFALPQSPQQYKQLLMASGFERYFQFARCFRDEDLRGDRQPEFTQLDLEMSFATREDVMEVNEKLLIKLVTELYPEKKIQQIPFPRISYKDAIEKYNSDRPDIREDKNDPNLLAFCWVIDFPFFEKTDNGGWTFTHNPFSAAMPEYHNDLMEGKNIGDIITAQYDICLNGFEIGGGSVRNHNPDALKAVYKIMGYDEAETKASVGHMIDAFSYGAPPHGGIAWGFDRVIAILQNEPNIREVIAFAKNGEGKELMTGSPSPLKQAQLIDLGLKIAENPAKK